MLVEDSRLHASVSPCYILSSQPPNDYTHMQQTMPKLVPHVPKPPIVKDTERVMEVLPMANPVAPLSNAAQLAVEVVRTGFPAMLIPTGIVLIVYSIGEAHKMVNLATDQIPTVRTRQRAHFRFGVVRSWQVWHCWWYV